MLPYDIRQLTNNERFCIILRGNFIQFAGFLFHLFFDFISQCRVFSSFVMEIKYLRNHSFHSFSSPLFKFITWWTIPRLICRWWKNPFVAADYESLNAILSFIGRSSSPGKNCEMDISFGNEDTQRVVKLFGFMGPPLNFTATCVSQAAWNFVLSCRKICQVKFLRSGSFIEYIRDEINPPFYSELLG